MHGNKKEKLNFSMIILSIVMLMSGLRADEVSSSLTGDNLGLLPRDVMVSYFLNFPNSRNPKINDFDLVQKVDAH